MDDQERDESFWGNGPAFIDEQNSFRTYLNTRNDWGIDREVQKKETFSGIEGVNQQDRAVQEAMGPIVDRSKEMLSQTDKAIVAARRLLLDAVKTVEDGGSPLGPTILTTIFVQSNGCCLRTPNGWRPSRTKCTPPAPHSNHC